MTSEDLKDHCCYLHLVETCTAADLGVEVVLEKPYEGAETVSCGCGHTYWIKETPPPRPRLCEHCATHANDIGLTTSGQGETQR